MYLPIQQHLRLKNPENESWKTVHHIQLQTNSGLHMKVEKCLNEFVKAFDQKYKADRALKCCLFV